MLILGHMPPWPLVQCETTCISNPMPFQSAQSCAELLAPIKIEPEGRPETGRPSLSYLALMVTVNELFAGLVSVPLKVAEPVTGMVPAAATVEPTVTTIVWPPPIVDALHVIVPEEPGAGP